MDDLVATLEECRSAVGAQVAALIGPDGLVIDAAPPDAAPEGLDLALAAAEATDLWAVAERLGRAAGTHLATDLACDGADGALRLRRLAGGSFVLLVAPDAGRADGVQAAFDATVPRLEEALA